MIIKFIQHTNCNIQNKFNINGENGKKKKNYTSEDVRMSV